MARVPVPPPEETEPQPKAPAKPAPPAARPAAVEHSTPGPAGRERRGSARRPGSRLTTGAGGLEPVGRSRAPRPATWVAAIERAARGSTRLELGALRATAGLHPAPAPG